MPYSPSINIIQIDTEVLKLYSKMRIFTFIWLGQLFYLIGMWVTAFALDISVFQQTGSTTQFALLIITSTIPLITISPIAGTLVDRWNRRQILIITHLCEGLCILILLALITFGQLEIWHIYLKNILSSIIITFQTPAYKASITSLVPKENLTRASGMFQLAIGVQKIISPLIAGSLLDIVHVKGVLFIELITLSIAIFTLVVVRFGEPSQTVNVLAENQVESLWQEITYGWNYIREFPGLPSFLILLTIYQFLIGFVSVLGYPLILSVTTAASLGKIIFLSGIGIALGALALGTWKDSWQNLISLVLIAMLVSGIWIAIAGFRPDIIQIGIATLFFFLTVSFVEGSVQAFLQTKVAENLQGRVFALTNTISAMSVPLAAVFAGPLADYVFEPLMSFDGPWSKEIVGHLIGSGPGRGIGLIFVIIGCFVLLVSFIGYRIKAIRQLENHLPSYQETSAV